MADGYENPSTKGNGGDRTTPKAPGGSKGGSYDNATASTGSPQAGKSAKPAGGGGPSSGYDGIKKEQDFGFSGHPKKRSPNI